MSRHEEIKKLWREKPKEPELFECFCYIHRCPHRDYSLCPKNCEKPGLENRCIQVKCQLKLNDPEACETEIFKLQKSAKEKPKHVTM